MGQNYSTTCSNTSIFNDSEAQNAERSGSHVTFHYGQGTHKIDVGAHNFHLNLFEIRDKPYGSRNFLSFRCLSFYASKEKRWGDADFVLSWARKNFAPTNQRVINIRSALFTIFRPNLHCFISRDEPQI